mmetsp:Transcript_87566/g.121545  ORF Transcript_87566/g.121545 Transcript_87566/m.121545 type:complete len:202 (-) Transcript_87566:67-672(-)
MVQLFSITVLRHQAGGQLPVQLAACYDLASFNIFQRGTVREVLQFAAKEVVSRSQPGDRHSIVYKEHLCHVLVRHDGLAVVVTSDEDYPQRVAFSLILKVLDGFCNLHGDKWQAAAANTALPCPQLEPLLKRYQDPNEADDVAKINRELDETKEILIKSLDQLLERGEKLEDLMDSADELSFQTRVMMRQAERMNSCCIVL